MQIKSPKELIVYQKAYALAMEIYKISKDWPNEEKFSLIDQIRRSIWSGYANLNRPPARRASGSESSAP
jgi:four helix bundle protein